MAFMNQALLDDLMKKCGGSAAKVPASTSKVTVSSKKKMAGGPSTKPPTMIPAIPKESEQLSSQQAASSGIKVTVSDMMRCLDANPSKGFVLPDQEVGSGAPEDLTNPSNLPTDSSMKRRMTKPPKKISIKNVARDGAGAPAATDGLKESPQSLTDKSMPDALVT